MAEIDTSKTVSELEIDGVNVQLVGDSRVTGGEYNVQSVILEDGTQRLEIITASGGDNKFKQMVDGSLTTVTADDLEGVTSIRDYAFRYCTSLTTITIPETVTSIKSYAFYYCTSLTTITIPKTVTSIGSYAVGYCRYLQTVIYKGQAPNIQSNCFNNCTSITKYDFRNCTTVPTLASASSLGHATGCQIIIPDALYDDWTTATNWVSLTGVTFVKASEYTE